MRSYSPDRWRVVRLIHTKTGTPVVYYRIFAGWYGGFTTGASWKMSSGVVSITEDVHAQQFTFENISGSLYLCHLYGFGMSAYMQGVLGNMQRECETCENPTLKIETLTIEEIRALSLHQKI